MKVLGISGGTVNGNNDAMCREALMGAKEAGADEIQFINLNKLHIEHCTGCIACVASLMSGRGGACVIKDDLEWLKDKMLDADALIFSIPIFEKGASGLFRTLMDRMGPRSDTAMVQVGTEIANKTNGTSPDPRLLNQKTVAYMGIGGSDWSTRVECDFRNQALTPMWKIIDTATFSWSKSIVMDDEKVQRAHQLGYNLVTETKKGYEDAQYLGDPGVCPHCHNRNFYLNDDSTKAVCCACGLEGELKIVNGKVQFTFAPEDEHKAHDTLSGKFIHVDDIKENEGKLKDFKSSPEFKARKKAYNDFITPLVPER